MDRPVLQPTPHRLTAYLLVIGMSMLITAGCGGASSTVSPSTVPADTQAEASQPASNSNSALKTPLPISSRSFKMGTAGYVPAGYPEPSTEQWQDFFQHGAAGYGELFGVHIDPGGEAGPDGVPDQVTLAFEQVQGVEPYVAFAVSHEHGPFTAARAEELKRAAVATAEKYQPGILSLGVESNSLYLFEGESYDRYVAACREIYDAVKEVSPHTLVMNNFQLERMKGETALTGQDFEPNWALISRFEGKLDLVSFTVYPYLNYRTVSAIPDDYLAEIQEHTDLPVMITETGWPSQDTASGVQGSEDAQVDYLLKLTGQANQVNAEAVIWVFPHDADFGIAGGIFDHISLRHNDGSPKKGLAYWQALLALPVR